MEIKILCRCGVKYKFDVEPVEGRVPFTVKCPGCEVDATEYANAHIAQHTGIVLMAPTPVAAQVATPVMAAVPAGSVSAGGARLRIAGQTPPPPASAPPAPPDTPPVARPIPVVAHATVGSPRDKRPPSFGLGLVGALLGTVLGVGLWLVVHNFIGSKSKFLILGVGFFTGLGARLLSRDEGSQQLGMIAATLTLLGVFGVQYWNAYQDMFGYDLKEGIEEIYNLQLNEAKKALQAMPNQTDEEIRQYLAKSYSAEMEEEGEGEPPSEPKSIPDEVVKEFRENDLKHMNDLVSGKISLTDLERETDENVEELKQSGGVKLWLVVQGFGVFRLGLLIASCGLAYRMSANA